MNEDLLKKTKQKKMRGISIAVILIMIVACAVLGLKITQRAGEAEPSTGTGKNTVTVTIECKALADDMSKLTAAEKENYVPKDGMILEETTYQFEEGETVYDALKILCREHDIAYVKNDGSSSGVYISSIGHLAEFDAGKKSGWLYYVNGETPNYACSKWKLKAGDEIQWHYTVDYTKE